MTTLIELVPVITGLLTVINTMLIFATNKNAARNGEKIRCVHESVENMHACLDLQSGKIDGMISQTNQDRKADGRPDA